MNILADHLQAKGKFSKIEFLKENAIKVKIIKGNTMHHKFAIFDNKLLETGSYNYTNNANKKNYENCLFITQENIINQFKEEFDKIGEA